MLINGRNHVGPKGLISILMLVCTQLSCSTEDLKIFGSKQEIESDAAIPSAATIDPVYKKIESSDQPKISDSSDIRTVKSKVQEVHKDTNKKIESSREKIYEDNDLKDSKTDVARLPPREKSLNVAPDNSRINRLQDGDPRLSAEQQGNSHGDIEITQKIRKTITSAEGLSVYARNVKIITRDGQVVLKGPVRSDEERQFIENTAVEIAGIENVLSGIGVMVAGR